MRDVTTKIDPVRNKLYRLIQCKEGLAAEPTTVPARVLSASESESLKRLDRKKSLVK